MPYAHKYANAVTELGILGALKEYLPGNIFSTMAKGGMAYARKDFIAMMELLIDAEMKMFKGIDTPVIFIQNVLTDMILGLGMKDVFKAYHSYIIKKVQCRTWLYHHEPAALLTHAGGMSELKIRSFAVPSIKSDSGCQAELNFMKRQSVKENSDPLPCRFWPQVH